MKIERVGRLVYVTLPSGNRYDVAADVAHALIRLGMEHQRERSADTADTVGMVAVDADTIARAIRKQPILATDIEAAIGEGE